MLNENVDLSKRNDDINGEAFADKLISFKGVLKILLFFSIQLGVLMLQLNHMFSIIYPNYYSVDFWDFDMLMLSEVIINYAVFGIILLLIFAFYLGKELKMRRKEKYIMFAFKGFVTFVIFLLLNATFIYLFASAFYLAKTGSPFMDNPGSYFTSSSVLELFFLWFFIIAFYLLVKISLFFVHLFTRRGSKTKNVYVMNQQRYVNHTMTQPNYNQGSVQQTVQTPANTPIATSNISSNFQNANKNTTSNGNSDYLTKEQIRQMQNEKIAEYKTEQQKLSKNNADDTEKVDSGSVNTKEMKPKTPAQIINFLNKHFFSQSIPEQGIIFFTISQFFWLVMLTLDIFSNTNGFTNFSYYYVISSAVFVYSVSEFFFYLVISLVYYDILKHYFKLPSNVVNKHVIIFLGIGAGLIFTSLSIGSYFETPQSSILFFVVLKFLVLLLIPAFYFGYKSQNRTHSDSLDKINPIFTILYNRSLNELRSDDKSAEIIKKYLQTHKEDIKRSLLDATPVNFKDNIKSVIINDYDRLETLLSYNNISVRSKLAVIDYSMEVFSTFLINLEVNLQDIYTEHLLTSNQDNLHKPISNEFIESKFTKLFSQWESLDWST